MISTKVTQTKPSGAAFHEPSAENMAHILNNYIKKKKLVITLEGSGDTKIVNYKFTTEADRNEFDADPVIVAMLQEGRTFNASNNITSATAEVI